MYTNSAQTWKVFVFGVRDKSLVALPVYVRDSVFAVRRALQAVRTIREWDISEAGSRPTLRVGK